jgi:hypothetical protein
VAVDLLQGDHVGRGGDQDLGDALEVDDAVDARAVMDVVRDDCEAPVGWAGVGGRGGNASEGELAEQHGDEGEDSETNGPHGCTPSTMGCAATNSLLQAPRHRLAV